MDQHERRQGTKQPGLSLSQETITIVTVGVALAGLILMESGEMRAEGRAAREGFEKRIIQVVEQQGALNGLVDGLRNPMPPAEN